LVWAALAPYSPTSLHPLLPITMRLVLGVKWQQIINSKRSAEGKEQ
jgi:hypothetical protein